MNKDETKILAFLVGVLIKVVCGQEVDQNEVQSLENIAGDLGTYFLDEREFRY